MIELRLIAIFVGLVAGAFISLALGHISSVWELIIGQVSAVLSVYVILKWIWPAEEKASS